MKKISLTIYCQGGLGNQLFQFIIGYILAKKNKISLILNIERFNSYNRKFELNNFPEINKLHIPTIKKYNFFFKIYLYFYPKLIKILKLMSIYNFESFFFLDRKFEKSPFIFNKNLLKEKITKNTVLHGFFQSEKYFIHNRKIVLKLFRFRKINNKLLQNYMNLINNKNSVAIHIRRGDYLSNPKARRYHGVLGVNYYKKSINYIKKRVRKPIFFIFSDDIELVKKTFRFLNNEQYIFTDTKSSINDLHLMSKCKHCIIANSSFSWWAAWLSTNKDKIICAPKNWTKVKIPTPDIIPQSWVKI
jgi:hypothetical protein